MSTLRKPYEAWRRHGCAADSATRRFATLAQARDWVGGQLDDAIHGGDYDARVEDWAIRDRRDSEYYDAAAKGGST